MNKRFALCFTFSCILISVQGQGIFKEGILIKTTGDTLRGFIKVKGKSSAPERILFKKDQRSPEQEMSLADVDAITITNYRYYKKIQTNESAVLSQFLVQGTANLFSWNKKFFMEKNEKLYALETEEIRVGTSIYRKKTYMGILKSVMIDCPSIQNRLNRVQLTETSLSEIVEAYNICIGAKPFMLNNKSSNWSKLYKTCCKLSYSILLRIRVF